jgi:UDP-N-acetylmuramoyl-L-alanyl-D-glutamate--2,6-diaminopimelate ligase
VKFVKYHGLGNDYIVIHARDLQVPLSTAQIKRICDRNFGAGSDGIALVERQTPEGFVVRIYNPDGSEAESSGNGMRIAARYLFDTAMVGREPFTILAKGERRLTAQIHDPQNAIQVDMGEASFTSTRIPMSGREREVLGEKLEVLGETLEINCVNVGNPHCVIVGRPDIKDGAQRLGPCIEVHESFPQRTNVQFVHVVDRNTIRIEIWERGAGYTLASGTSSCAAASVCRRLGLVDQHVTVLMPGGQLQITVADDYRVRLTGPITKVMEGAIEPEVFAWGAKSSNAAQCLLADLIPADSFAHETKWLLDRARADGIKVSGVTCDSRTVKPGEVFFAIQGAKHDARLLINEAFDKGAAAVVYEGELPLPPKGLVIPVVDIRRALSYAAHVFFGRPSLSTINIGITGTSGKTSVAWILSHALHYLGKKTFLGGTLGFSTLQHGPKPGAVLKELGNTTIDPITVQRFLADAVRDGAQASVFEATSQGVVHRRMRDVAWDGVIFTNLSRDHMDLHGTMEAYEAAKRELFTCDLATSEKQKRFAVINIDDPVGARLAKDLHKAHPTIQVVSIALEKGASSDYHIDDLQATTAGLEYSLRSPDETIRIRAAFIGTHNAYNVGCAALALRALGYSSSEIETAIAKVHAVPGRLEPLPDARVPVFIDYAHKPDALEKVLRFLKPVCTGRLISVFGCGGDRDTGKRPIMGEISYRLADLTVVTCDNPRSEAPESIIDAIVSGIASPEPSKLHVEVDRRAAIEYAIATAREGDVILIAGKGHEPYQEIKGVKHPFSDLAVAQEALEKQHGASKLRASAS